MELRSKRLHPVVEAFLFNLRRASTFATMPGAISYKIRRDQLLADCATFNTTGKLEPNLRQFLDSEPSPEYQTEFNRLVRDYFAIKNEERQDLSEGLGVGHIEIIGWK